MIKEIFTFCVVFETKKTNVDFSPSDFINGNDYSNCTHMFDDEMNNILKALWYIYHLPRTIWETAIMDIPLVLHMHDVPHNIIIVPFCKKSPEKFKFIAQIIENSTLIISEDSIFDELIRTFDVKSSFVPLVKVSDISTELLQIHWKKLQEFSMLFDSTLEPLKNIDSFTFSLDSKKNLPLLFFKHQMFKLFNKVVYEDENYDCNKVMLYFYRILHKYAKIIIDENNEFSSYLKNTLSYQNNFLTIKLVITFPGTMSFQKKITNRTNIIPENEKEVIELIGYHRAIAKASIYHPMPIVPQELYTALDTIEQHCRGTHSIKNKFIWNQLNKISEILSPLLSVDGLETDNQSSIISHITAFTDFPIGLARFNNCSSPICCTHPISYRPLTPLTCALQFEISKKQQFFWTSKNELKILILECISEDDPIKKVCDSLNYVLKEFSINENVSIHIIEANSIEHFKSSLKEHYNVDILIISAHGFYNEKSNMAGIIVNNTPWMMHDFDINMPPLVLFNACHVMPRGRGVISIADICLRNGALAVLGTLIPVDVDRNSNLILRFLVNIFEVRKGWSNMQTLDCVWSHTVASNAIHEIIPKDGTKLSDWFYGRKGNTMSPHEEFKNVLAPKRVRIEHVYQDTESLIMALATKDGMEKIFDLYIKSTGYFPESLFYQFIGMPENIFFQSKIFDEFNDINDGLIIK